MPCSALTFTNSYSIKQMARKVFVSFLGTSNYIATRYVWRERESAAVRFVQQALIEMLCADWTDSDRILIFYTSESCRRNWLDDGQDRIESPDERLGLQSVLAGMNLQVPVEHYEIPEGFSEQEIWQIFDCVYDKLQPGDRIHFDVTHAFRSIPLFSTVLFNFSRLMKQTELVSILYGAFEKLGPANKVREALPNPADRRTPIIDLSSLVELQSTNLAVNNFMEFGKVGAITDLLEVEQGDSGKAVDAIKCLKQEFEKLDNYIATCRMRDIQEGKYMKNITARFNAARYSSLLNRSEKLLLDQIRATLSEFKPENTPDNIKAAVNWALKYEMIQQAYTLSQEFIISQVAECVSSMFVDDRYYDLNAMFGGKKEYRQFVSAVLGMKADDKYIYKGTKPENAEWIGELADDLLRSELIRSVNAEYDKIRINRNNLNHAKQSKKSNLELVDDCRRAFNASLAVIDRWKQKAEADEV